MLAINAASPAYEYAATWNVWAKVPADLMIFADFYE